jgi:hypothetical protein
MTVERFTNIISESRFWLVIVEMVPIARKPTIEESIIACIGQGWAFLTYAVRQFFLLLPCLWAGYDRGRRREEKAHRKAPAESGSTVSNVNGSMALFQIGAGRAYRIAVQAIWEREFY